MRNPGEIPINFFTESSGQKWRRYLKHGCFLATSAALAGIAYWVSPSLPKPIDYTNYAGTNPAFVWKLNNGGDIEGGADPENTLEENLYRLSENSTLVDLRNLYEQNRNLYDAMNEDGILNDPRILASEISLNDDGRFQFKSLLLNQDNPWETVKIDEMGLVSFNNSETMENWKIPYNVISQESAEQVPDVEEIDYEEIYTKTGLDRNLIKDLFEGYKRGLKMKDTINPLLNPDFKKFLDYNEENQSFWEINIHNGNIGLSFVNQLGSYSTRISRDTEQTYESTQGKWFMYAQEMIESSKRAARERLRIQQGIERT